MGYTMELWAVPVESVVRELADPSISPRIMASEPNVPIGVAQRWAGLAADVAAIVRNGGGEMGGAPAVYVHMVVRALGTQYGSLDHTSAGGAEFRRRFLPGPAADRLGQDFVAALVNRVLAGLTWADYPLIGWASTEELRAAAARAAAVVGTSVAPQDAEPLDVLLRAVNQAARVGIDLVSVYG